MMTDIRQRTWDFGLTIATVVLLGTLGIQSFIGTLYTWWAQRTIAGWELSGYAAFVATMNLIAAPQLVALIVVMGLCVPKRLFDRRALVLVSALMLVVGAAVWFASGSLKTGLAAYLTLAALIQVAVVALTVAGASAPSYLTEGRLTKVGSGLLHLGFIMICFVVAVLQQSRFMLPAFVLAAAFTLTGTTLSFYAGHVAYRRRSAEAPDLEASWGAPEPDPLDVPDHGGDEGGGELDELG